MTCKILKTAMDGGSHKGLPGTVLDSKGRLVVLSGDGTPVEILSIQPESRKAVSGADFANGARVKIGEEFRPVLDNERHV
jgi:methionyl-tRNA formyltransferase